MHNYSCIIIQINYGLFNIKIQDKTKPFFIEYNVTKYNKMNETKNNGRKEN